MGTKERWDNWYPTLLDMVMMSSAKGFSASLSPPSPACAPLTPTSLRRPPVGTPGSTYSLFAALRVKDWNDGLATEESR